MNTCLIVIDAQESFRHRPYFTETDVPAYLLAQNALIQACQQSDIPIVRIFHVAGLQDSSNAFSIESGLIKPILGLQDFTASATFYKNRHSALIGTGLEVWLHQNHIGKIIISGIRTEQCCETTTRHASDLGFSIDFALNATLTWAMSQPNGQTLSAEDIKLRTATVLQERFADVLQVKDILEKIQRN